MSKKNTKKQREAFERLIRTAALTVHPSGRISLLAERAKVHTETIRVAIRNGKCSVGLACALELAVGRDVLKKEELCPDFAEQ